MRNSYTNKIVLVTGGTSGIGKAAALAFAKAGAKVVITGRREKEGADVAAEITKNGGTAAFVRADVAKDADAGHIAGPQASIYMATKHAVEGLTKAIALEFAKQGIRVNSVSPGGIDTDMLDRFLGKEGDRRNSFASLHPVGRFGASEEIAAAVLYLASDAAKFTTGTTLLVDGGLTAA
jgi:NAD(P)-dependent dehydrogenase (short-subunit alcohol dehydrogenase family)